MFYMGGITAQRVTKWAQEKGIEVEVNHQELDGIELAGFDKRICEREQVILKMNVERLSEIVKEEIGQNRNINSYVSTSIGSAQAGIQTTTLGQVI